MKSNPHYVHETVLTELTVVCIRPYRINVKYHDAIQKQILELLEQGIISPTRSGYNAPVVPVVKKTGDIRLCLDLRALIKAVKEDGFPLPNIDDILMQLGKCEKFTCLDLPMGYHQIQLSKESSEKTSFCAPLIAYKYVVLPFGLKDTPASFQKNCETCINWTNWPDSTSLLRQYCDLR